MKIDGVRVIKAHEAGCSGELRRDFDADGDDGCEYASFVCDVPTECRGEVWIRVDKICEFAADLMRQVEEK